MTRIILFHSDRKLVEDKVFYGGLWIIFILALSMFHTLIGFIDYDNYFVRGYGLGIIYIFDGLIRNGIKLGYSEFNVNCFLLTSILIYGLFSGLWYFAVRKFYKYAYSSAIILIILDSGIFLLFSQIIPIIIHAIALWFLYNGYRAFDNIEIKFVGNKIA